MPFLYAVAHLRPEQKSVSLWLPQEALSPLTLLIGFLLPAEPGLMTRGRHGCSAVEHRCS